MLHERTTGNPKGVVYSHRSSYLHSMAVCAANNIGLVEGDRVLPVVQMFHANAWGQPYAAVMAGAGLLLPDRFLQAEPLVNMIDQHRPTFSASVPTIWNDVLQYLHANPGKRHLLAEDRLLWRFGRAAVDDQGVRGALRRGHPAGLGHDRNLPACRAG